MDSACERGYKQASNRVGQCSPLPGWPGNTQIEVNQMRRSYLVCLLFPAICLFGLAAQAQSKPKLRAFTIVKPARDASGNVVRPGKTTSSLATFTYNVTSSRDGNSYTGIMVGQ